MIKVTDLMIGDYVTFADCIENPPLIPIKIVALSFQDGGGEKSSLVSINNDKACDIIDIDEDIVGIPLTPEILEKSGFEKQDGKQIYIARKMFPSYSNGHSIHYFPKQNLVTISLIFDDGLNAKQYMMPCSYLHELQHALKICKIDKEITL